MHLFSSSEPHDKGLLWNQAHHHAVLLRLGSCKDPDSVLKVPHCEHISVTHHPISKDEKGILSFVHPLLLAWWEFLKLCEGKQTELNGFISLPVVNVHIHPGGCTKTFLDELSTACIGLGLFLFWR